MRRKKVVAVATVALSALAITGTAHAATKGQQLLVCGEGSGYRQVTLEGINQRGKQTTVSTAFPDKECTGIPGYWWVGDVKVTLSQPPHGEDSATQWCTVPKKLKNADFVECRVEPRDDTPDPNDGDITDDVSLAIAMKLRDGATQADVERFLLDEFGLEEISEPVKNPGRDLAEEEESSTEELYLPRPYIYKDKKTDRYLVAFQWHFQKDPFWIYHNQTSFTSCATWAATCKVGGEDGVGVAFDRRVAEVQDYTVSTWGIGNFFKVDSNRMHPVTANTTGVGFAGQDKAHAKFMDNSEDDFNLYHGAGVYDIKAFGCGSLQAFSKYTHTWDDSSVNSIGIGLDSVTFGWSTKEDKWELQSKPAKAVKVKNC